MVQSQGRRAFSAACEQSPSSPSPGRGPGQCSWLWFPQKETPRQEFECKSLFGRRCAHWRAGGKRGREGSQGRRVSEPVSTVAACGCRELDPPGSLGSRVELAPPSKPAQGHRCVHSHWAWLRAAPGGRVPCTPGPVLRGGAGTRGLELCELISRGWRAQAVSVRGGRGVCPLQGAENTGDTLHPAV